MPARMIRAICGSGAAVSTGGDTEARLEALARAGVDVVVVDTAHGHSRA